MYKLSDVEILEAFDDYWQERACRSIPLHEIWLEAFKRGTRFNPIASQPADAADKEQRCSTIGCNNLIDTTPRKHCNECLGR